MPFDDPQIRRGLDYLRRARGQVRIASGPRTGEVHLAQGLGGAPVTAFAELLACLPGCAQTPEHPEQQPLLDLLFVHEIREAGSWQLRTDAPAGGWPHEAGAQSYLDVEATCAVLDALGTLMRERTDRDTSRTREVWSCIRRGCQVMLAMQESDGSFSRFERGESNVWMSRLPWRDAALLSAGERFAAERIRVTAKVLLQLHGFGWRADDDRIARGLAWLSQRCTRGVGQFDTATVSLLTRCFAAHGGRSPHPMLAACAAAIRGRQHEDGSFGSLVDTAAGLRALLVLENAPCVQAHRAAAALTRMATRAQEDPTTPPSGGEALALGLGLSPLCTEPYRGVVEAARALHELERRTSETSTPSN